jgi:hypothetical protein
MKIKINVVYVALILMMVAVAVLYYKEQNIIDLFYFIFLLTQLIRYIHRSLN